MKIAIIGAGFTGLAAGYSLCKKGNDVTIFEKGENPGGLALGFKHPAWQWTLEEYYHHWFTNDKSVLSLAKEIGFEVLIKRPKTSVFVDDGLYQLDSPLKLLTFPRLSLSDRLRMAGVLAMLKFDPFWKPFEKVTAARVLPQAMGRAGYKKIWEPQLINKFGEYTKDISLAWFWARIAKRTSSLAYPKGGFLEFSHAVAKKIREYNGKIFYKTGVDSIQEKNGKIQVGKYDDFDRVIVTVPSFLFLKMCPQLPTSYVESLTVLKGLGAQTLILRLANQFFTDNTYWLSVCEKGSPVTAIVEHTNFMDKKHYNNEHIVYLGNYLPRGHRFFSMSKESLLKEFEPLLLRLNKNFTKEIIGMDVFSAPFAQPIIPLQYSKIMPPFKTPIPHVYLANIQQVYPWDRGTNYAVELGEKVARLILPS